MFEFQYEIREMAFMNPILPSTPGSYNLLLYLPRRATLAVGRLGSIVFKRGYYLYLGSAFGPGGVRSRVQRHLMKDKKHHWHIDYLRDQAKVKAVGIDCLNGNMEHHWARKLMTNTIKCDPIDKFGCSDCTCPSHLFYFKKYPDSKMLDHGASLTQFRIS
jgi:Uri superfamily endonuclease